MKKTNFQQQILLAEATQMFSRLPIITQNDLLDLMRKMVAQNQNSTTLEIKIVNGKKEC